MCTANQCRSPTAAGLLRLRLREAGIDAEVSSAGLQEGGLQASPLAVTAVRERGVDLTEHTTRQLDRDLLAATDLVLGMARVHVREVVALEPTIWPRAFTLKELVRRGSEAGERAPDESLDSWLARVDFGREVTGLLRPRPDDDVADPVGKSLATFRQIVHELDALVRRLVVLAWAPELSNVLHAEG